MISSGCVGYVWVSAGCAESKATEMSATVSAHILFLIGVPPCNELNKLS
jgi:hypothetical protein